MQFGAKTSSGTIEQSKEQEIIIKQDKIEYNNNNNHNETKTKQNKTRKEFIFEHNRLEKSTKEYMVEQTEQNLKTEITEVNRRNQNGKGLKLE